MAARSTTAGTPVKSCIRTRAGRNWISYLWPATPIDDESFTRRLLIEQNVAVLPGSYLSREIDGFNPGAGRLRLALVAPPDDCIEAAQRIRTFIRSL